MGGNVRGTWALVVKYARCGLATVGSLHLAPETLRFTGPYDDGLRYFSPRHRIGKMIGLMPVGPRRITSPRLPNQQRSRLDPGAAARTFGAYATRRGQGAGQRFAPPDARACTHPSSASPATQPSHFWAPIPIAHTKGGRKHTSNHLGRGLSDPDNPTLQDLQVHRHPPSSVIQLQCAHESASARNVTLATSTTIPVPTCHQ